MKLKLKIFWSQRATENLNGDPADNMEDLCNSARIPKKFTKYLLSCSKQFQGWKHKLNSLYVVKILGVWVFPNKILRHHI